MRSILIPNITILLGTFLKNDIKVVYDENANKLDKFQWELNSSNLFGKPY